MGAEHQLIDGKDNSDPPYQGELRARENPLGARTSGDVVWGRCGAAP